MYNIRALARSFPSLSHVLLSLLPYISGFKFELCSLWIAKRCYIERTSNLLVKLSIRGKGIGTPIDSQSPNKQSTFQLSSVAFQSRRT